jgi:uncharacterized protein YndB with AHSA1/START domain
MLATPQPACLVIADISGYTGYLAGVELDHAQDILADLVDTVVGGLRPTLRLAKLEGDAAFAYVIAETVDPSLLQDTIEATYFAFQRRLRDIKQASQCECNACILIPSLDLKFVVHHGLVIVQHVAGNEELVGRDVILIHRLLKNSIQEATGVGAYALYTQQCVDVMGFDPAAQGMVPHTEVVDIIGEVRAWVRDLATAWREEQLRRPVIVGADDAEKIYTFETAAAPPLVWEFLTSPARRPQWSAGTDRVLEDTVAGRRGAGTTNHCVHGRDAIIEEILDWRPYDYWTTRSTLPLEGAPRTTMTEILTMLPDGGTRAEIRIQRPASDEREGFDQIAPILAPMYAKSIENLIDVLGREVAERLTSSTAEPALPSSSRRYAARPENA